MRRTENGLAGEMPAETPCVVAVSGVKNSGKTTFLEGLLRVFRKRGLRTAVIKHDGHAFEPDVPGTDSYRLRSAGASGVAVYSVGRFMVIREEAGDLQALIREFSDYDLILLEGQKYSDFPKIEVVRGETGKRSVCRRETLLALAADEAADVICDWNGAVVTGVPRIGIADYEAAADLIERFRCRTVTEFQRQPEESAEQAKDSVF